MGAFSNTAEKEHLDHELGNTPMSQPPGRFVALFTVMPNESGSGGTEAGYTGYARQSGTFSPAVVGDPTEAENTNLVDFGDPDADLSFVGFGVYDSLTGGTLRVLQPFPAPVNVQAAVAEAVQFQPGDLKIQLD